MKNHIQAKRRPQADVPGATAAIANFVSGVKVSDIPGKAFEAAAELAINTVGIIIGGAAQATTRIVAAQAREMGGTPEASVAGTGFRTSAPMAAYVNGTAAHTFDMDDSYVRGYLHPSVVALPAVLALAEARGASGRDAMAAYIVGLEVGCRLSDVTTAHLQEKGFHPTGTVGPFGALAGCAWLMKLNAEQVTRALGIQVSLSSGIVQNVGTMVKPLHAGNGAKNGMLACLLASKGFLADPNGIEGKWGFVNTFNYGAPIEPWENLTEHLGNSWAVLDPGITIKFGPCQTPAAVAAYGTMSMMGEYGIAPGDIERIEFGSNPSCGLISKFTAPKLSNQAKYSSPYIVAVAVLDRALGPEQFFDERVTRPDVQDMARKVTVYVHDELKDSLPKDYCKGHVRIVLKNGRVHEKWFEEAKGGPGLPYAREELRERFFACAKHGLAPKDLPGAYDAVAGMAALKNLDPLMTFIRGASQ